MARALSPLLVAVPLFAAACDGPPATPDGGLDVGVTDAAADVGSSSDASQSPVTCADRTARAVFPSSAWQTAVAITVPEGDRVGDRLRALRPGWALDIARVAGFPRRPVLVVPLAVTPLPEQRVTVAPQRVRAAGRALGEAALRPLAISFDATVRGDAVVIRPLDAFPRDVDEVLVGIDAVAGEPDVVPACDASGAPDPVQEGWRALWPGGASEAPSVVLRLRLQRSGEALVALDTRLASSPALEVVEAVATSRADLGADAPDDETSAALRFPVASGHLRLPEYRRGDEPMVLGADGAPEPDGVTEPGFLVVLPARGTAPYPVVLFQHGGGQSPRELFRFAGPLARAGFAFVAIDLPEHGHRAPPGGGSDLSFLDFERPLRTRENFRQAAADHLAVLTGLDALEAGVGGALGVSEPDLLDGTRVFYMGLSLGGITGSLTSQVSRELSGAALFVAGAGYPELLQYGLFTAPISRVVRSPQPLPWALLGAVSIALDGADPFAYAQQVDDLAAPPIPVVQLHAIDDPLISDEASEQWARAFGATLVRPWHHEVATLTAADLPHADGFVRGDARATRAYVQCPMPGVPSAGRHGGLIRTTYAQELVAHCFAGVAQGGACEVIDTGFAD